MTSKQLRYRTGLMTRLRFMERMSDGKGKNNLKSPIFEKSFALKYLAYGHSVRENTSTDAYNARILKTALTIAHEANLDRAIQYLKNYEQLSFADPELLKSILTGDLKTFDPASFVDQSAFQSYDGGAANELRKCYEDFFEPLGVSFPLNKQSMAKIVRLLDPMFSIRKIQNLKELEEFCHQFFSRSWPIFSPATLTFIHKYFKYRSRIGVSQLKHHAEVLRPYGLERLHSRLVLLKAVNGDNAAIEYAQSELKWEDTGFDKFTTQLIQQFITIGPPSVDVSIVGMQKENPIECAIMLSIYIMSRRNSWDFLMRLEAAYEIDPSILNVLNWDLLYVKDIQETSEFMTPQLVFLASVLDDDRVMRSSRNIANQYGKSGAPSDLRAYADYFRSVIKKNRSQFFASFSVLGPLCRRKVFRFLLKPGMIDTIANVFPAPTFNASIGSNIASTSLDTKLACLQHAVVRKILPVDEILLLASDVRKAIRQQQFSESDKEGRLRIQTDDLASELARWLNVQLLSLEAVFSREKVNKDFKATTAKAVANIIAGEAATAICFTGRFAFDIILAGRLRHFFLADRMTSSVEVAQAGSTSSRSAIDDLIDIINDKVDSFCSQWLTIGPDRSFIKGLTKEIESMLSNALSNGTFPIENLSIELASEAVRRLSNLLIDCQKAWITTYKTELETEVRHYCEQSSTVSQSFRDQVTTALDEAFDESHAWMAVNEKGYVGTFLLGELLEQEAVRLKPSRQFRRNFQILTARSSERGTLTDTSLDIQLPAKFIEPIVDLIDNLINNACKHSGLGVNTPVLVRIDETIDGFAIAVVNEFKREKLKGIEEELNEARRKLKEQLQRETLLKKGGTGLKRVIHDCNLTFEGKFDLHIPRIDSRSCRVTVRCSFPIGKVDWHAR